jgi:hypothetical protein
VQTVREFMTEDVVTIESDSPIEDAARLMREYDIGLVAVMDGESLRGVVTDRDIVVKAIAEGRFDERVGSIVSETLVTVRRLMSAACPSAMASSLSACFQSATWRHEPIRTWPASSWSKQGPKPKAAEFRHAPRALPLRCGLPRSACPGLCRRGTSRCAR